MKRLLNLTAVFAVICACAASPGAALIAAQERTPTFRTRAAGVSIDVLVTDNERPVAGLTAKDFELTDSGVAQTIEVTSLRDLPVDVIIVLDISTSLRDEGLRHLVRATDTLLGSLQSRDRAALVTFSQVVVIRAELTPEHATVRAIARDLKIEGTTSAIDAVFAATTLQTQQNRASLLLVFSDGIDTASWLRPDQVIETARRSAVVPYAVVLGVKPTAPVADHRFPTGLPTQAPSLRSTNEPFDPAAFFLRELVATGGGVFMEAENTRALERRFAEALDSFRERYVITYVPRGVEGAGWHPIDIRVKGRHRVRARPGYVMP